MSDWGGSRPGAGRKKGSSNTSQGAKIIALPKKRQGGARANAGRKPGTGKYGEPTAAMRVPVSLQDEVMQYIEHKGYNLPLYATKVPMGLMKESIDYVDRTFNLNELIRHPQGTFFHPVEGDSMEPTIFAGDLAMIDTVLEAGNGDVVLASIDGEVTLKRFRKTRATAWLEADNKKYPPIDLEIGAENLIVGVMLVSIRPVSTGHIKPF